ncbi:MAG: membrane protein insertase YidC [Caldimonas sp.]
MTDIRRTVLWGIFLASLFFIYESWNRHNGHPSLLGTPPARVAAADPSSPLSAVPERAGTAAAMAAPVPVAASAPSPTAERVTISTDVVRATLDGVGGTLARVELLKYPDQVVEEWYEPLLRLIGKGRPAATGRDVVLLDESADRLYVAETGLVPTAGGGGLPNHHTVMTVVPGERVLAPGKDTLEVKFESPVIGGVKLVKTYTFRRGDYVIDVKSEVLNESGATVSPRLYLQLVRDGVAPPGGSSVYSTFTGPAIDDGNKYQKIDFKEIEKRGPTDKNDHVTEASAGWIAMVQHYFASVWLIDRPDQKLPREYYTGKADVTNPTTGRAAHVYSVGMLVPLGAIAPGATRTFDAKLFVGPQEEQKLSALAPRLELVKDYGIFKVLSEPLFWLLTQIHKILGNWGWSIVGLVVLLKIAFFWLNAKAYGSMAKMKAINPRIVEMRARLKDKPQQMQQEMMRIYREEKVNPLGGCLPIVVQMPFFIALYWVLLSTVEMRNAPWIGWITDLSAKDPFFILPLLMTGTSLLQTWLNPTPPDPVQARMMWIMPLVFSVMFFFFPAGLVLYWLTNNILSIAQQYLINKRLGVLGK